MTAVSLFPADFGWRVATTAHQHEGGVDVGGHTPPVHSWRDDLVLTAAVGKD